MLERIRPRVRRVKNWRAGRESNPDLQLRTLPCCSVTLPTHLELAPGIQPGSPDLTTRLGPKRHHALDHASLLNVEGMQRIEL
jgi:hypothetical protein